MVAISLQNIKDQLERSWCYAVAFDGSTHQSTSYFDIRLRVFVDGEIKNVHLIALPMFERHTGAYVYELFKTFFDVLNESWTTTVIGVTTDGASNMTGCHRGIVTMIQNAALHKGFYRIRCALKVPCQHDFFLMDIILLADIPQTYKEIFNRVRLNMQLLTVSDIVISTTRSSFLPDILRGTNPRSSKFIWPTPQTLPNKWLSIFKQLLLTVIKDQLNSTPLGHWITHDHQTWNYIVVSKEILHIQSVSKEIIPTTFVDMVLHPKLKCIGIKPDLLPPLTTTSVSTPMEAISKAPKWMKSLWRTTPWDANVLDKILTHLNNDDLISTGEGFIRNQWGSYHWCFTSRNTRARICTRSSPVDGSPNCMKIFRAASSYVLSALSLITILEPFISNTKHKYKKNNSCQGLINKIHIHSFNRPSLVMSDHIDMVYQIRHLLNKTKLNLQVTYSNYVRPSNESLPTPIESLMFRMHCGALTYYTSKTVTGRAKNIHIAFPAQQICIFSNNNPIVVNISEFLQESERTESRNEYFQHKFGMSPESQKNIDTYTFGRVIQRNKHRHFAYAKIIHSQLNTMSVNKLWTMSSDICPVCYKMREDWYHNLTCDSTDLAQVRSTF